MDGASHGGMQPPTPAAETLEDVRGQLGRPWEVAEHAWVGIKPDGAHCRQDGQRQPRQTELPEMIEKFCICCRALYSRAQEPATPEACTPKAHAVQ